MYFNFNQSRVKCPKLGFKVHVIKALIGMKEKEERIPSELEVLSKAVDYIKALEREVVRLEAEQPKLKASDIVNVIMGPITAAPAPASMFGRLFGSRAP